MSAGLVTGVSGIPIEPTGRIEATTAAEKVTGRDRLALLDGVRLIAAAGIV